MTVSKFSSSNSEDNPELEAAQDQPTETANLADASATMGAGENEFSPKTPKRMGNPKLSVGS